MKKISVAIAAHNEEESIYRTLKSVSNSEIGNLPVEIWVCLSWCNDNTENEVLRFIADTGTEVKLLRQPARGKSLALKMLDQNIDNEIIVFVDADSSPTKEAVLRLYNKLLSAPSNIKLVSGNGIDPRYMDKTKTPHSLIEAFNMAFNQHPPRHVMNGQLFSARKGVIQVLPDDVKLDDVYTSLYYWDNFDKDNEAILIQGSAQTFADVLRYQKNIQAGKKQIAKYLGHLPNFREIAKAHYSQFDIKLKDKKAYYPNISYWRLIEINLMLFLAKVWGNLASPSWNKTTSSKEIAE